MLPRSLPQQPGAPIPGDTEQGSHRGLLCSFRKTTPLVVDSLRPAGHGSCRLSLHAGVLSNL